MVELATRTERRGGITLVEAAVTNDGTTPRQVRLASELDGPVWPPRRRGVPAEGWTDGTLTVQLSPGERVGLGFASPADPVDPPVSVVESRRASPDGGIGETPTDVVRALGDPAPPRDVSPLANGSASGGGPGSGDASDTPEATADGREVATDAPDSVPSKPPGPPAVAAWLAAVERRIECGDDVAGTDPGAETVRPVTADPACLRAVAHHAARLAARAERGDRR